MNPKTPVSDEVVHGLSRCEFCYTHYGITVDHNQHGAETPTQPFHSLRLYLSGPMSSRLAFSEAAHRLRAMGHYVLSPAELDFLPQNVSKEDVALLIPGLVIRNLFILLTSAFDAVAVLDGWESSKGARLEVITALFSGMRVLSAKDLWPIRVTQIFVGDMS